MSNYRRLLSWLATAQNMSLPRIVAILRSRNLLLPISKCDSCHETLNQYKKPSSKDVYRWKCMTHGCDRYKCSVGIRKGSFFSKFKSSLKNIWIVICCWLCDVPIQSAVNTFNIPERTVIRIYSALRRMAVQELADNPIRLGGPGIVCEIDESMLSHKAKYHRGRRPGQQIWCFGIVDTSFKPARGYVEIVPDRKRDTLCAIISRVCRQGSIIHSDEWAAYSNIQRDLGFQHSTVNHSVNFVNPLNGCHTQHIESYWNRIKQRIKRMNGIRRENLPMYLAEFAWKDYHRDRSLVVLLGLLRARE